jgi:hypothetical protein
MIPQDPDALLGRKQTADALTEAGYPVAAATLTTMASRGGGPPAPFLASRRLSSRSAAAFLSVQRPNLDKMGVSCIFCPSARTLAKGIEVARHTLRRSAAWPIVGLTRARSMRANVRP